MGVDCCAYGSVGKGLGIVRARNWLPILGAEGSGVVGVKVDGLEGAIVRWRGGEAEPGHSTCRLWGLSYDFWELQRVAFPRWLAEHSCCRDGICEAADDRETGRVLACNHNPWIGSAIEDVSVGSSRGLMQPTYMAL